MSTPDPTTRRGRRRQSEQPPDQGQLVDPPQHETPAEPPAAIEQPKPSTELSLPERALAAMKLQVTAEQLAALAASTATITTITNPDGRKQAHAAAMVLADKRIEIKAAGKAAREDAVRFQKEVIAQESKLVALIEPEETRLLKLRDDWDTARENERKAKVEADRLRLARIHERIQEIRDRLSESAGKDAAGIETVIKEVAALAIDETFAELKGLAEQVHASVLTRLRAMHVERVKFEQERAEAAERERQRKAELDAEIAKQRQERELNQLRVKRIGYINGLVLVATIGRENRKPGTRECITETLAEAKAMLLNEAEFGDMLPAAVAARDAAVQQIEHTLQRFDEREADRVRREQEERERQEAAERQRAEQQRLDEERERAQAEQRRIAEANARQAEDLQRQQAELERQRQEQEAARVELERQQKIAAATSVTVSGPIDLDVEVDEIPAVAHPAPMTNAEIELMAAGRVGVSFPGSGEIVVLGEFQPSADDLIGLVSAEYGVGPDLAAQWLRDAFAPVPV